MLAMVSQFCATFVHGTAEYGTSVDTWLEHRLVGESEATVTGLDGNWLALLQDVLHATILRDQHDPSSKTALRPDATLLIEEAVFCKVESKARAQDLRVEELTGKFFQGATRVFPRGSMSVLGILTSPSSCRMFKITFDAVTRSFQAVPLAQYTVGLLPDRVRFITDIVKLCRWFITIDGPNRGFHLRPNVRTATPNGHHITWTASGLLKQYRADAERLPAMLLNITAVYQLRLANVEWGAVLPNKDVLITRVGVTLRTAILSELVSRQQAIAGVRAGLDQLHNAGWAHCDLHLDNVFVSMDDNSVFLNDLEYLARTDGPLVPHNYRLSAHTAVPNNPQELDELQFAEFEAAVYTI